MRRYTEIEFQRMKLEKGDVLVVTTPEGFSGSEQTDLVEFFKGFFPDNEVLLVAKGIKLEAYQKK